MRPPLVILIACLLATVGCSLVEFERSPYAPRGLDVVYSHQEDITFLVWRVGEVVDFERVDFEIFIDGKYQPVDPEDTLFSHQPFSCDRIYQCVQFQLPGLWEPPEELTPLRAVDHRHGIFHTTPARIHDIETTFSIDPVPAQNNSAARADLTDWFSANDIPIRRDFQWTLVPYTDEECSASEDESWSPLQTRVTLPQDWTNPTPCFALRPAREDTPGVEVARPLIAGPMLFPEEIDERIPVIDHPTLIAFLVDLQVTNLGRCNRIVDTIEETIITELSDRPAPYRHLGIFRPIAPDATEDSGCDQQSASQFPLSTILAEAEREQAFLGEDSTLVLIYLNNVSLPPSDRKQENIAQFFQDIEFIDEIELFSWSIGSNLINGLLPWSLTTPWAPIEDENFAPNLESSVAYYLPLRTEGMDQDTPRHLPAPNAAPSPKHFRICTISPDIRSIRLPPATFPYTYFTDTWPWPAEDEPELYFDIVPQRYIPYQDYRQTFISGVYEVCDDFCENPFVGPADQRYPSWLDARGVCQWN